jgi:hypothetical protein
MATPEIAGIAALMLTMKNNLIPQEIRNILMKTYHLDTRL